MGGVCGEVGNEEGGKKGRRPLLCGRFWALFDEMRRLRMINPKDNEACEEAIRKQDELDIQIKQLQQEYHGRFLMMLPANKVLAIIKAEEKFHRQIFRKMK